MSTDKILVRQTSESILDPGNGVLGRDNFCLPWRNEALRFLTDVSEPMCYPGKPDQTNRPAAANPTNGQAISNIAHPAGLLADGDIRCTAGQVRLIGGALDFTQTSTAGQGLRLPGEVLADLHAPYNGLAQRYMMAMMIRLPKLTDWPATNNTVSLFGDAADNTAAPAFGSINLFGHPTIPGAIQVRRQVAASTTDEFSLFATEADCWAQLVLIRWADGRQTLRLRTPSTLVTRDVPEAGNPGDNVLDFSANRLMAGRPSIFASGGVAASSSNLRFGWVAVANLARDPATDVIGELDKEYTRVIAQQRFS
nr:hypothetical protein [uncultured organism]